jgi:hypothetical protein
MTIEWTKCSERMPPENLDVIVSNLSGSYLQTIPGALLKIWHKYDKDEHDRWVPYTFETWMELTRK